MTEILRRSSQQAFLDLRNETADTVPTAVLTRADGTEVSKTVSTEAPPTGITQRYSITIGIADTATDGELTVLWTVIIDGESVAIDETYEVITPYLSISEVKEIYPTATDAEAVEVEAAVRHVINAHTGQSFGYAKNRTQTVEGHGEAALRLPERLVNLTGVSTLVDILDPHSVIVVSDGWYLKKRWTEVTGNRTTENTYWGEDSRPGGVIYAPSIGGKGSIWKNDYPFEITGDWGYKSVPAPVKEAARLLVNDYACSEQLYRDRYLESIKAADWRLQFSSRAWEYTGNVRADQLLSEYVILDWAVI